MAAEKSVLTWNRGRPCIFADARLKWKKRSEETQTLRAGCSKAEPKIFAPPQTPFPGRRGTAKI